LFRFPDDRKSMICQIVLIPRELVRSVRAVLLVSVDQREFTLRFREF
jgi:hypothetical protein